MPSVRKTWPLLLAIAGMLAGCGSPMVVGGLTGETAFGELAGQASAAAPFGTGCNLDGLPVMADDDGGAGAQDTFTADAALPTNVDLRSGCTPIRNQGDTEACVAFSTCGLGEYLARKEGRPQSFSPRFLWAMLRKQEHTLGENVGTNPYDAAKIVDMIGLLPDAAFPMAEGIGDQDATFAGILSQAPDAALIAQAKRYRLFNGWQVISSVHAMKQSVARGIPVVFATAVFPSLYRVGRDGMLGMPAPSERPDGGHALLCVGYDNARRVFIVRNSWGSNWGAQGYFYMPYGYVHAGYVHAGFTTK